MLILASQSASRKKIFQNAGIEFTCVPAGIDEAFFKGNGPAADMALTIAEAKAQDVSIRHPDKIVIGADQVLEFEGRIFSKAKTPEEAVNNFMQLRGKKHALVNGVVIVENSVKIWSFSDRIDLEMDDVSDDFIRAYVGKHLDAALGCVGGYAIEGEGIRFFKKITGDYFSILGLPILPLLNELKRKKVVKT